MSDFSRSVRIHFFCSIFIHFFRAYKGTALLLLRKCKWIFENVIFRGNKCFNYILEGTMLKMMTKTAYTEVGYIAFLRQLAFLC